MARFVKESGLTLVEVMVAMLILSLVMVTVLLSSSHLMNSVRHLEQRTQALWVAQAVGVDIRTGALGVVSEGASFNGKTKMGTQIWYWVANAIPFEGIIQVDIGVSPEQGADPVLNLQTYMGRT